MDVMEAIRTRKSIRKFKPDPVPKEILMKILDAARYCSSSVNTQPWEIHIITGELLENIKRENVETLTSGVKPHPEVTLIHYEGVYRQRQVATAVRLFKLMGIAREDRAARAEWEQRGYRFFDAPVGIILATEKSIEEMHSQFDIGAMTQTICLAALNYGLGTCIEDQGVMFPEVVRKFARIPDSSRLVVSIAMGYPDWDFPANEGRSARESAEDFVTWYGFD